MAQEGVPNWSSTLEDLLDDGNSQGAKKLLEGIVGDLEGRADAPTSLTLAAALTDLASLYDSEGLSIKADSCSTSALLIKKRAETQAEPADPSYSGSGASPLSADCEHKTRAGAGASPLADCEQKREEVSSSGSNYEEDWETFLCEGLAKLDGLLPATKTPELLSQERNTYKQRGRGAFTYGEMGMYIDRLTISPTKENQEHDMGTKETEVSSVCPKVACGVRHVLVVTFPPKVTTKDLEDLFEPFASHGVAIRWVNDTTALAVFGNPEMAKVALRCTKNPHFKVEELTDDNALVGLVNEGDLQPPVPRPATSSQAAHRMIMGALRRQGINNKSQSKSSFQNSQKQESERKQRLLTRQKLRDEAWGSDG